jgi:Protein of unknown function (DUF1207)
LKYRRSCLLALALLCLAPLAALGADDAYTTGYVAAVLERQFNINPRSLKVKDGIVTIDAGDVPRADRPKIVTALSTVQGVTRVQLLEAGQQAPTRPAVTGPEAPAAAAAEPAAEGFLPTGHLFRALIADPRWPRFSVSYRYYINTPGSNNAAAVSFGETIPLYRDHIGEKGKWGQWETGVQGGTFSIFDLDSQSFDLINTDFFVAGFVGYRFGDFSALARIFHQSSHLGDELLLRETRPNRVNLSYEGLDAKLSYDLPLGLRAYGGGGYLTDVDPSNLGRGLAQAGAEFRSPWALWQGRLRPVAGIDLQFREENSWQTDLSLRAGLQFEHVSVLGRNLQILVEYFKGPSFDGQFFKQSVEYLGIGAQFNF